MQEEELIVGIRNGDEQAFEKLFRAYYAILCTYANSMLNDRDDAEEVVQSIFLGIWESRNSLSIQTSIKAYLYKSVYNTSLNRLKHEKVKKAHSSEYLFLNNEATETTIEQVQGNELAKQISEAITKLPTQCQNVFRLSRQQGLSYAEIAEQLGISTKAVDKQIVRALRILRAELQEYIPAILLFFLFNK